jgi:pyruvate/2-oxoglutarate dehydrogenase complex dihydrolipoamide acyltransferase (E2) component
MPQMGISVSEGTILEWRKRPGDWIEADETIADVTTDKVDVEIPAPAGGRLESIRVEAGETVAVGTVLAEIDAAARPGEAHPDEDHAPEATPQAAEEKAPEPSGEDRSGFYSPVVRRIADKHNIDLGLVEGTGVGGRVRKRDVLAFIENGETAEPVKEERPLHIESPYRPDE